MITPGTVLQNRYAVERQIGEGGMGAVYLATDTRFGSTVALKETFFDDPSLRKAFEREARLLNRPRHRRTASRRRSLAGRIDTENTETQRTRRLTATLSVPQCPLC